MIQSLHMDGAPPAYRDRLSLLLGGAALGLTLSKVVQLPTQQFGLDVFGSPLGVRLSTSWLMTLVVVALVAAGAQSLLDAHPRAPARRRLLLGSVLPVLTTLMLGAFLARIEQLTLWIPLMAGGIALLGLVAAHEYRSIDPAVAARGTSQILLAAFAYSLALGLLSLLYGARLRTLVAAPTVFLVSGLLAVRLLWTPDRRPRRVALYGGVVGLVVAQCTWILGYWSIPALSGATILLLVFYILTGLAQGVWEPQPGRRALLEYGLTTLLAIIVVLILGPR